MIRACNKCKKTKDKCNCGRDTVMTPEVIVKLEEAFALGCSDREACFFAGICTATLYNYQKINQEFLERKEVLKSSPVLKARRTVIENLNDPKIAIWYLEKRKAMEFGRFIERDPKEVKLIDLSDDTKFQIKQLNNFE